MDKGEGRASKWGLKHTPKLIGRLCELLVAGSTRRDAWTDAGIGPTRFHRWMKQDPDFASAVVQAEEERVRAKQCKVIKRRPVKRTPERAEKLLKLFARGSTRKDAFLEVGITGDTFGVWMRRDPKFAERVDKAEDAGATIRGRTVRKRQSKCCDELVRVICRHLENGSSRKYAYDQADIVKDTFYKWMREDPEFSRAVLRAEATFVNRSVEKISKAMDREWRAAAWLLSKRAPRDFGKRVEDRIEEEEEDPGLSEEEVLAELAELKARVDRRRAAAT